MEPATNSTTPPYAAVNPDALSRSIPAEDDDYGTFGAGTEPGIGRQSSPIDGFYLDPSSPALAREQEIAARRSSYQESTREELKPMKERLERIRGQRSGERGELVARLGEFGFTYDPKEHRIVRFQASAQPEPEPEAVPLPPPAPMPPSEPSPDALSNAIKPWMHVLTWGAIIPLGFFLGYSIGLMAGFDVQRNFTLMAASAAFGMCILACLKVVCAFTMREMTRQARRMDRPGLVAVGIVVVLALLGAELTLAARAIHHYSAMSALRDSDALPLSICLVIAACFSTPVLLMSAMQGWSEGELLDHDREDKLRRDARHAQENLEAFQRRTAQLEAHAAAERQRKDEARRTFEEAEKIYAENPRWQSALSLYSMVTIRNQEIEEEEQRINNLKIERGMARRSEVLA